MTPIKTCIAAVIFRYYFQVSLSLEVCTIRQYHEVSTFSDTNIPWKKCQNLTKGKLCQLVSLLIRIVQRKTGKKTVNTAALSFCDP